MGIVAKQSFWNSINSYLGVALGALNTMVFFPYVFLADADFNGEIQTVLAFAAIASTLGHLGLPITITTYFPRLKESQRAQLWSLALLLISASSMALGLASLVVRFGFGLAANNIFFALIITLSMLSFELFAALSQHHKEVIFPQFLKQVFRRMIVTVALALSFFLEIGHTSFYYVLAIGYGIQVLLALRHSRRHFPTFQWRFDQIQLRPIVSYGLMVMLASAAMILVSRIDILMIRGLLGKAEVAFYNIAFFIGTVVSVPSKALFVSLRPFLAKAWADQDLPEIESIYRRSALNQMISTSLIFLLIWVNLDLAWLIIPEEYQFADAAWVVLAIALGEIIQGASGVNGIILTITDRQRFNFYTGLALIGITIATNFLFIPRFGLLGAAVASFSAMFLINLIKLIILGRDLHIWPHSKALFQVLFVGLTAFGLVSLVQAQGLALYFELPLGSGLVLICFGLLYRYSQAFDDLKGFFGRKGK